MEYIIFLNLKQLHVITNWISFDLYSINYVLYNIYNQFIKYTVNPV